MSKNNGYSVETESKENNLVFTKAQILQSRKRPAYEKDIIAAMLEEGKSYTLAETDKIIQNYLTKGVN